MLPTPLSPNTDSMTTVPASMLAMIRPHIVTTGPSELRSTCRQMIFAGDRPKLRATSTCSRFCCSTMVCRVTRLTTASAPMASAIDGRVRW